MRINRFIARTGKASRRGAEELVKSGLVFVNGKKITELATEIDPEKDEVILDSEKLVLPGIKYFMFNKPKGYTVTKKDKFAEKTVFELLPKESSLFAVGRLDRDTTGLILITNDGEFDQNITHPSQKIEKEYLATTKNPVTREQVKKLVEGVVLEDGLAKAIKAEQLSQNQIRLVITEGRNRQVRRMIAAIDNEVVELKRIRIGNIVLDVEEGNFRELAEEEIKNYV